MGEVHDDRARLDQDWYAYSVLCYWLVTKYDPFGEGTVKDKPDADRIYRMRHVILNTSSKVKLDYNKRKFIERAIERLGPVVKGFAATFAVRYFTAKEPLFLLDEFHDDNIMLCGNIITRKNKQSICRFKQIKGFFNCFYCEKPTSGTIAF